MRVLVSFVFCVFLSGCALNKPLAGQAIAFNKATEEFNNKQILLNIVRASRREPMYFTSLTSFHGDVSASGTFSLTGTAKNKNEADSRGLTLGGTGTANPTFDMVPMDTKEFAKLIATPLTADQLQVFLSQNWPIDLLGYMLFASIEIGGTDYSWARSEPYEHGPADSTGDYSRIGCPSTDGTSTASAERVPLSCLLVRMTQEKQAVSWSKAAASICVKQSTKKMAVPKKASAPKSTTLPADAKLIEQVTALEKAGYKVELHNRQVSRTETYEPNGSDLKIKERKATTGTHIKLTPKKKETPYLCVQDPYNKDSVVAIRIGKILTQAEVDHEIKQDALDEVGFKTHDGDTAKLVSGGLRLRSIQSVIYRLGELARDSARSESKTINLLHPERRSFGSSTNNGYNATAPLIKVVKSKPLCFFDDDSCYTPRDGELSVKHAGSMWIVPTDERTDAAIGRSSHAISLARQLLILSTSKEAVAPPERVRLVQ